MNNPDYVTFITQALNTAECYNQRKDCIDYNTDVMNLDASYPRVIQGFIDTPKPL